MEREGFTFLAQPTTPVGWNILLFGTYEPELRAVFRASIPEGGIAVDVGANSGWHSLLMARLAGPNGRVFAAEPNPSVREKLFANLKANCVSNVEVLAFALSDTGGLSRFHGPPAADAGSGSGHLLSPASTSSGTELEVETRPLDDVLGGAEVGRLDLLKIDVEGFEWPVLRGAQMSLARFRPHIVFEYNAEYVQRGGGSSEQFERFFELHRYDLLELRRNGERPVRKGDWPDTADIWARPRV